MLHPFKLIGITYLATIIILLSFGHSNSHKELDTDGVIREYSAPDNRYYDGEILLPDYAHSDTLIVVDAKSLNLAMKYNDGSDGSINAILQSYCYSKYANLVPSRDYQIEIVSEDSIALYDGNRLVGVVFHNWDNPSPIDALIQKDNL